MRLENIVTLSEGSLLNQPSITAFTAVALSLKEVSRGALFIAYNPSDIDEALQLGAYGILFQGPTQITDNEVAWIKVTTLDTALLKLLRFILIEKEVTAFQTDSVTLELAKQLQLPAECKIADGSAATLFSTLRHANTNDKIIFKHNALTALLFPSSTPLEVLQVHKIEIIEQTLFETSFIYNDRYYERALLSPFFIPFLQKLLNFLDTHALSYAITSFKRIGHFSPVFVSKNLQIKEFGATERVLIFEPDIDLVMQQIAFLDESASWAKLICLIPKANYPDNAAETIFTYETTHDIMQILETTPFHYALIAKQEKSLLDEYVSQSKQMTINF